MSGGIPTMENKLIFVSGGVLSGIGKGLVAASLGYLLKQHGYKIGCLKCENYLNYDSGTINPIEHGDPFLCNDGLEADMDLQGILGIDSDVRNGFSGIKVHFVIDADASAEDIAAIVAQSQKRSAVFDIVTNPTDVTVTVG